MHRFAAPPVVHTSNSGAQPAPQVVANPAGNDCRYVLPVWNPVSSSMENFFWCAKAACTSVSRYPQLQLN